MNLFDKIFRHEDKGKLDKRAKAVIDTYLKIGELDGTPLLSMEEIEERSLAEESLEESLIRLSHPDTVRFVQGEILTGDAFKNVCEDLDLEMCYEAQDGHDSNASIGYFVLRNNKSIIGVKASNGTFELHRLLLDKVEFLGVEVTITKLFKRQRHYLDVFDNRDDGAEIFDMFFKDDRSCWVNRDVDLGIVRDRVDGVRDKSIAAALRDQIWKRSEEYQKSNSNPLDMWYK